MRNHTPISEDREIINKDPTELDDQFSTHRQFSLQLDEHLQSLKLVSEVQDQFARERYQAFLVSNLDLTEEQRRDVVSRCEVMIREHAVELDAQIAACRMQLLEVSERSALALSSRSNHLTVSQAVKTHLCS